MSMEEEEDGENFVPKLVVFDLDFTLWPFWADTHVSAPFSKKSNGFVVDSSGYKIKLYDDTLEILRLLESEGIRMAAASRTEDPPAARELLTVLDIDKYFSYKEIYPGSKVTHFRKGIKLGGNTVSLGASGIPYSNMLFFDDEERNIHEISRLGVTCILVQRGMKHSVLKTGLEQFAAKQNNRQSSKTSVR